MRSRFTSNSIKSFQSSFDLSMIWCAFGDWWEVFDQFCFCEAFHLIHMSSSLTWHWFSFSCFNFGIFSCSFFGSIDISFNCLNDFFSFLIFLCFWSWVSRVWSRCGWLSIFFLLWITLDSINDSFTQDFFSNFLFSCSHWSNS